MGSMMPRLFFEHMMMRVIELADLALGMSFGWNSGWIKRCIPLCFEGGLKVGALVGVVLATLEVGLYRNISLMADAW